MGITEEPHGPGPTPAQLKALRALHGLTQASLAERLGVTERQVQRWEAGEGSLAGTYWQLLRQTLGFHAARHFERAPDGMTRGWDTRRDVERDTIERGDVVELQPIDGPRLGATVCAIHHGEAIAYEAIVTEFVDAGGAGEEHGGFWLGERVRFDCDNVLHLEQRAPRRPSGS